MILKTGVRALASSLFITMRTIADGVRLLLTALVLAAVYGSVSGSSADSVITACVFANHGSIPSGAAP